MSARTFLRKGVLVHKKSQASRAATDASSRVAFGSPHGSRNAMRSSALSLRAVGPKVRRLVAREHGQHGEHPSHLVGGETGADVAFVSGRKLFLGLPYQKTLVVGRGLDGSRRGATLVVAKTSSYLICSSRRVCASGFLPTPVKQIQRRNECAET